MRSDYLVWRGDLTDMTSEKIRVDWLEFEEHTSAVRLFVIKTGGSKVLYGRQAERILTQVVKYRGIYTISL
jgi:hypothetical protein